MQTSSPLLFVYFLFQTLKLWGGFANRTVIKLINGRRQIFTITQRRKGMTCYELVARASVGRFYKRVVRASLEN